MTPQDLTLPDSGADPGVDTGDLTRRAAIAVQAAADARARVASALAEGRGLDGIRPSLWALGVNVSDARVALAELDRRAAAAGDAPDDAARVAAILGDSAIVLPILKLPDALAASFAASTTLQGGDPLASVTWLQRAAHVREGVSRLEAALMYAEALGSPERLDLRVAQLPHAPGDRWVALPSPVAGGRVSFVAQATQQPVPGRPVAGLLVDEWTEVVPARSQVTGVSVHVDQPDARAPQAVLLAVPPTEERVWSLDALESTVLETLDLARLRLVDPEALGRTDVPAVAGSPPAGATSLVLPRPGHFLPATYLASEPGDRTVTTDLSRVAAPREPD
jgi:hypothetical protein